MSGVLPFSQQFVEAGDRMLEHNPALMLTILVPILWNCFTALFIIKNSNFRGTKLFLNVFYVMFFVIFFITQIGAMYSVNALEMTRLDMILNMISGLFALLVSLPLMVKFFQNKNAPDEAVERKNFDIKAIAIKLGLCGLVYLGAYFIFAFGVQWQFDAFRLFYANTPWGQTAWHGNTAGLPPFILITAFRGVINGFFILPLLTMITKNKRTFLIAACLTFVAPAINHVAPNPMFPDMVRLAHLIGMTGTMTLFGIVAGNILWGNKK